MRSIRIKSVGLCVALAAMVGPAFAADVGVSVSINQPGVYGRIDIGRVAVAPVLVYAQPVVVVAGPVARVQRPIYLHVPPGHAKQWRKHCGAYNACGQPVYFVKDSWYEQNYRGKNGHKKKHKHD